MDSFIIYDKYFEELTLNLIETPFNSFAKRVDQIRQELPDQGLLFLLMEI